MLKKETYHIVVNAQINGAMDGNMWRKRRWSLKKVLPLPRNNYLLT